MSAQLSRCVAVYSRHFVASRINAPAAVVVVVFTLDHFVTTQRTMGWTKSLLDPGHDVDIITLEHRRPYGTLQYGMAFAFAAESLVGA